MNDNHNNDPSALCTTTMTSTSTTTPTAPLPPFWMNELFHYIDTNQNVYIERLREAVAIPSISSNLKDHLQDIHEIMNWTVQHITRLGGTYELRTNPLSTDTKPLPPILLATFLGGQDSAASSSSSSSSPSSSSSSSSNTLKTVCVYGHLDVQPAAMSDGWDTDPFILTERNGMLYGRGSTDDKGPAISWLWVIEAYQTLRIPLPVNIKILYEGMEEYGSDGMDELIRIESNGNDKFLSDVDFFCISDNYWIGTRKPCLTYGLRGMVYFSISVQCCEQDLHSGVLGGIVYEGMNDLVQLLASLVDTKTGQILIKGIMDDVRPITIDEDELYNDLDFDVNEFIQENKILTGKALYDNKKTLLQHRWRYPSLSIHGIEGDFSGPGAKTVIPAKCIGKFSIRLVPDQDPVRITQLVKDHMESKFAQLGSPNIMKVELIHGAKPWLSSPKHPNYEAAAIAQQYVYGMKPDYTREGGSIPIANMLEDATGMNVLLLPIGACDDQAHSQNEKYNISNMMNGIKVLVLYLHELGKITGPKPSSCRCIPSTTLTPEELMIPGAFMKGFRCKCEM